MQFEVVTLFPELFESYLAGSILGRAQSAGLFAVHFTDPRNFTFDKHRTVDDAPYGGGVGMVMKPEPIVLAVESAIAARGPAHRILMTPAGTPLRQSRVKELAAMPRLLMVCGRYEGIDARVTEECIDEEISVGDFVLAGGEISALALIEAVARYVPGVLGEATSTDEETFSSSLVEYPQYTRPPEFRGRAVPDMLFSGNHARIKEWRQERAIERTRLVRPDMLAAYEASPEGIAAAAAAKRAASKAASKAAKKNATATRDPKGSE